MPMKKRAAAPASAKKKRAAASAHAKKAAPVGAKPPARSLAAEVESALAWLRRHATAHTLKGMARYAIPSDKAFGVSMSDMRKLAKQLGPNHALALALWKAGWYEARMLATLVDDPEAVTPAQMDRWCADFDSWAICDTACFCLFDRTPHAWKKVAIWRDRRGEFARRASFALLASLALHDKQSPDAPFLRGLRFIERAASDERNFVKKGVNWALRGIGRRNRALNAAAIEVAKRLADSADATSRWVGKDALRAMTRPAELRRLARRESA